MPHLANATAVDRRLNNLLTSGHRHMHLHVGIAITFGDVEAIGMLWNYRSLYDTDSCGTCRLEILKNSKQLP
jgi:hypothetical protein